MIKVFEYQSSPIQFDEVNGQVMANATAMCRAFNKNFGHWLELKQTQGYIEALRKKTTNMVKDDNGEDQFVMTRKGGVDGGGGSWIHEKLIIRLSQWLNPDFAVWCDDKLAELIKTGSTSLASKEPEELLLHSVQLMIEQKKRINSVEKRVDAIEAKSATRSDYFAVIGYASLNKIQIGLTLAASLGRRAKKICQDNGYPIESIPDPRFGRVHTYPYSVLEQVFNENVA